MRRTSSHHREISRFMRDLMSQVVALRLAKRPEASEAGVRDELAKTLSEQAGLEPNRLEPAANESAMWVLMALLELEGSAPVSAEVANDGPACG